MQVSDKWNPRLWLRDWLNKPTAAELAERRTAEAAAAQMLAVLEREAKERALKSCLHSALNAEQVRTPCASR